MAVSVSAIPGSRFVLADVSFPSGAYEEVVLSAADFGFSSAIVGLVGLVSSNGYTLSFDPSTSTLSRFGLPEPYIVSGVVDGVAASVDVVVPGFSSVTRELLAGSSVLYFPDAGGCVDVTSHVSQSNVTGFQLDVDTSAGSLVVLFQVKGQYVQEEIAMPWRSEPAMVFRVVAWGF